MFSAFCIFQKFHKLLDLLDFKKMFTLSKCVSGFQKISKIIHIFQKNFKILKTVHTFQKTFKILKMCSCFLKKCSQNFQNWLLQ